MAKAKEEPPKDQRQIDREAELARQQEVNEAMEAFYVEQRAAAEKALHDQEQHELTGVKAEP